MNDPKKIVDGYLVLHAQNGDKKAFSLLVKRWHSKLCKQAYWYVKDTDLAKDLVQDSWSTILKGISKLKEPNYFGAWATKIVHRKSIDYLRKRKREQDSKETYLKNSDKDAVIINSTVDRDHKDILIELVQKTIKELPENQQLVLRLFYLENYSLAEISSIIEISIGTVKSRLFYAREHLKSILKNKNYE